MAKINLLNRVIKHQKQKRTAHKNSVCIIVKEQNNKEYFVLRVDENGYAVIWIDNHEKALQFHTEKGCQHYVHTYLNNRKDIHLKWMDIKQKS